MDAGKKTNLMIVLFVLSVFILFSKLMIPSTVQVIFQGESTFTKTIPNLYTLPDVILLVVSSFTLGISAYHLLSPSSAPPNIDMENKNKEKWENILKTLKNDEQTIFRALLDAEGTMFQSELVEKTGLPKSTVSLALDKLEARGFLERRRHGMSNAVVVK